MVTIMVQELKLQRMAKDLKENSKMVSSSLDLLLNPMVINIVVVYKMVFITE